jgi:hypothetical protein
VSTSPTELRRRSAVELESRGYTVAVAECRNGYVSRDLFGMFDLLALRGAETLGVQVTDATHIAAHARTIAEAPAVGAVREAGWTIVLHGWRKIAGRWTLTVERDLS